MAKYQKKESEEQKDFKDSKQKDSKDTKNSGKFQKSKKGKGFRKNNYSKDRKPSKLEPNAGGQFSANAKFNDVSWYTKIDATEMSARMPFTRPTGRAIRPDELGLNMHGAATAAPGMCIMHYVPSVGSTEVGVQSAIDRASHKIWMEFRTKNTGAITYDAPDIIFNLISGVNIHAFYFDMSRVYGLIHKAMVTKNEFVSERLVTALGFNYASLLDDIAQFGVWLNTIKSYINDNVHIPSSFTLYDRYMYMNAGVYKDEDLEKYQIYAFKADGYWIFNEREPGEAGFLEYAAIPAAATLSDLKTYFNTMWTRYALSESMADIQSGYFKYFGDNFRYLPTVNLDYTVEPLYSFDMMRQIQNAVFVGPIDTTEDNVIVQDVDTGFLIQEAYYKDTGVLATNIPEAYMLSLFIDQPTSEDVIEATRCVSQRLTGTSTGTGDTRVVSGQIGFTGSEIYTYMDLVSMRYDEATHTFYPYIMSGLTTFYIKYRDGALGGVLTINADEGWVGALLDAFSYHPTLFRCTEGVDGDDQVKYYMADLANMMIADANYISRIHELCIMSQFTIF